MTRTRLPMIRLVLPAVLAALSLTACSTRPPVMRLAPGTPEAEVIARAGTPTQVFRNPDGGRTLEFSNQPKVLQTYMVTLSPEGKLLRAEPALTEERLARIKAGTRRDEVTRLLGKPAETRGRSKAGEQVWTWNVTPTTVTMKRFFHVYFIDGVVTRTEDYSTNDPFAGDD